MALEGEVCWKAGDNNWIRRDIAKQTIPVPQKIPANAELKGNVPASEIYTP